MKASMKQETHHIIKEVLPWIEEDYLEEAFKSRKREISEVLEILDSLTISEIPEEVKDVVKRPRWEVFLAEEFELK